MGKTEVTAEQTRHPRTPLGDIVEAGAGPTLILGDTLAGEWQCEWCHKTPKIVVTPTDVVQGEN